MIVQLAFKNYSTSYQYQVGIVPEMVIYIFRILQALIYLIFQWSLILQFKIEKINIEFDKQINGVLKWLKILTLAPTLSVISFLLLSLLSLSKIQ